MDPLKMYLKQLQQSSNKWWYSSEAGIGQYDSSLPLTWDTWANFKYGEWDLEPFQIFSFEVAQVTGRSPTLANLRDKLRSVFLVIAGEKNPTCRGLSLEVRCLYQLIYKIYKTEFHCELFFKRGIDTTIWESFGLHAIQVTLVAFVHFHQLRDELINVRPKIWGNNACLFFVLFSASSGKLWSGCTTQSPS